MSCACLKIWVGSIGARYFRLQAAIAKECSDWSCVLRAGGCDLSLTLSDPTSSCGGSCLEWKEESRERPKEIDPMIWRTFLTTFLKVDKDEGGSIELCGATAQTLD